MFESLYSPLVALNKSFVTSLLVGGMAMKKKQEWLENNDKQPELFDLEKSI